MSSDLLEPIRHGVWANRQLIENCAGLTPVQLQASLPTGAGTPLRIMKHLIGADSYYLSLFRGGFLAWDWSEEREDTPQQLLDYIDDLDMGWEEVLMDLRSPEQMLDTSRSRLKAGVLLSQALHHGHVHREQVCAVLTSIEVQPPDISGWAYGRATGGIIPK